MVLCTVCILIFFFAHSFSFPKLIYLYQIFVLYWSPEHTSCFEIPVLQHYICTELLVRLNGCIDGSSSFAPLSQHHPPAQCSIFLNSTTQLTGAICCTLHYVVGSWLYHSLRALSVVVISLYKCNYSSTNWQFLVYHFQCIYYRVFKRWYHCIFTQLLHEL